MRKNSKTKWNCEPSLAQLLSDPLVNTLMAADRVDPQELSDELRGMARDLTNVKAPRAKGFFAGDCCRM